MGFVWVVLLVSACGGAEPDRATPAPADVPARAPTHAPPEASVAEPRQTTAPPEQPIHAGPAGTGARAVVKLVTFGAFPEELLDAVEAGLRDELQVDVQRIERVALPQHAFYAPRRRYRAERLLDFLDTHLASEPRTTRVLGMTNVDISTTKDEIYDWGVLGLGSLGGRSCVISTHRMKRRVRDTEQLRFRAVSTAVHEVGHTLGLEHCDEPRCVMRDAEGRIATVDETTGTLGPGCRTELDALAPQHLSYVARGAPTRVQPALPTSP